VSWNGSGGAARPPIAPKKSSPSALRGLIAGAVVVAIAAVAYFVLTGDNSEPKAKVEKKASAIKEVTPAPAPKPKVAPAKPAVDPKARPTKVGECVNGYVLLPSGRLHRRLGVITNNMNSAQSKMPYEVFDFHCENEIACMLTLPPGENLVGTPVYNGRFKKEFLESLKQPIIIEETDSDYVKDIKKQVRETKIEMKAALDRGEDIEQMMLDARKEAQQLAMYKMQLENEVDSVINNGAESEKDVEDCIKAMNSMLEAKGIAPVDVGLITKRKLRRLIREKGQSLK